MITNLLRLALSSTLLVATPSVLPAAELLTNGSFESNAGTGTLPQGWTNQGTGSLPTVQVTGATAQAGAWSVRVAGRAAETDGLRQNITSKLAAAGSGVHRWCRAYVRVDAFASARVLLRLTDANGQQPDILLAEQIVRTPGQWIAVEGGSTITWTGTLVNASLRLEVQQLSRAAAKPAAELPDFHIDDLTLDDDLDADDILDREETALGFDPALNDTDADGLPDRWELDHAFSPAANEAELDADEDGFTNRQEFWAATDPRDAASYPGKPANPNANAATRAVLRWLALLPSQGPGRHLVVGQHVSDLVSDPTEYPRMVDGLATATGRYPAMVSLAIEQPTGNPLQIQEAEARALAHWQAGGIPMLKWAIYNPWNQGNAGDQSFVDIPGLLDPNASTTTSQAQNQLAHDRLLDWMSQVGDAFARLQEQGVVVMFRPMSEMNGPWFWWGHRSYADYTALWNHLYDYFTNTRGLNNLIWVYESAQTEHAPAFVGAGSSASDYYYPGDDRVDAMCHNFYSGDWVLPWDGNRIHARYPKIYGIPQAGPDHANRTGTFDNLTYVNRTEAGIPRSSFFIVWNSFTGTDPATNITAYRHIGIVDNANAGALMNHPSIIARDAVPAELFLAPSAPTIDVAPPARTTLRAGADVTLNVTASGAGPLTYQWFQDGAALAGATAASLTLPAATSAANGSYTVQVTNPAGTTTSAASVVDLVEPGLVNLSVRALAGTGDETLIVGFVTENTGDKTTLVRAVGPGLAAYQVPGFLPEPVVTLFDGPDAVLSNTIWTTAPNADAVRTATLVTGAFALDEAGADSALLASLPGGAYTVQVADTIGRRGVVLVEAYDAPTDPTEVARLRNLSARGFVGTDDNILIGGVVIGGSAPRRVLIRAVGPTLAGFEVAGVLADPVCEIKSGDTTVATLDNWNVEAGADETSAAAAGVGAFPLAADSLDAAGVVTLAPGAYTIQVRGAGVTTGIALLEIYDLAD